MAETFIYQKENSTQNNGNVSLQDIKKMQIFEAMISNGYSKKYVNSKLIKNDRSKTTLDNCNQITLFFQTEGVPLAKAVLTPNSMRINIKNSRHFKYSNHALCSMLHYGGLFNIIGNPNDCRLVINQALKHGFAHFGVTLEDSYGFERAKQFIAGNGIKLVEDDPIEKHQKQQKNLQRKLMLTFPKN